MTFIAFLISLFIGTFAIWLMGKLSPYPPKLLHSFIAALIIEVFSFVLLPLNFLGKVISFVIAVLAIMKIVNIEPMYAIPAALLYRAIELIILFLLLGIAQLF